MRPLTRLLCLLLYGLISLSAYASSPSDTLAKQKSFQRFAGVPVLAYSEETRLQYGILGIIFFKPDSGDPYGSQIDAAVVRSQNSQIRLTANPIFWLLHGRISGDVTLEYRDWPGEYYGMGNDLDESVLRSYDMQYSQIYGNLQTDPGTFLTLPGYLHQKMQVGLEFDWEKNQTSFPKSDDSMSNASQDLIIPQNLGGMRCGLGWNLRWDTRDHDYWPRQGQFLWFRQIYYRDWWASDWNFTQTIIDLRTFFPLPMQAVLGLSSYQEFLQGSIPFDRLAQPDGVYQMRGLVKGLLRDQQQWILRSEYRQPLFWRFAATAFVEVGKVGSHFSELWRNPWHSVYGIGGRLAMNPSRKINIRGDLSWVEGGPGLTLYFKEAF